VQDVAAALGWGRFADVLIVTLLSRLARGADRDPRPPPGSEGEHNHRQESPDAFASAFLELASLRASSGAV
jgi:hypothetical protein